MDEQMEQIMKALRRAIEIETPKLKEGQTLKTEISLVEEGVEVHVYPITIQKYLEEDE